MTPNPNEKITFVQAMMKEFKKPEQTAAQFLIEFKQLNDADKLWYREALIAHGYNLI